MNHHQRILHIGRGLGLYPKSLPHISKIKKRQLPHNRLLELDFLRTISMLAVMMGHASSTYLHQETSIQFLSMNLASLLNQAVRFSVPLFLLLSGFSLGVGAKQTSYFSFLKRRAVRVLLPYLMWTMIYSLSNTGYHFSVWLDQLANPSWLLRTVLTGQSAPHLYFIPIILQCYLLYPLLKRWVDRWPVQSTAWAMAVTLLLQGCYTLHHFGIIVAPPPVYLWLTFPVWGFYFVAGMFLQTLDLEHLKQRCKENALPLLAMGGVLSVLYSAVSLRTGLLHAIKPELMVVTIWAFFCGIGVWEWIKAWPGLAAGVTFLSCHSMGIYYCHVLIIYFLHRFPRFLMGTSGMLLLFFATLVLSAGFTAVLSKMGNLIFQRNIARTD